MKRIIMAAIMAGTVCMAAAQGAFAGNAPLSLPELKNAFGSSKPTLLFFQNPYGGPCRNQKAILDKLQHDRKNSFNIVAVNAMDQSHQKAFYDYGVRSLPSLVLVDKSGNISKVFPPGIQQANSLSAVLDGLK